MSKAILVTDMPNECRECPCFNSNDFGVSCGASGKEITYDYDNFVYTKPDWCPLKHLPKKQSVYDYALGWNDCIDEILGEKQ
jgi:hypothetical protein